MAANAEKSYFAMPRGLNTESPLISFPDGYTTDEQNYELKLDGSRRRRAGIALETGGEQVLIEAGYEAGNPIRTFDWENVASVPSINFLVMQVGYLLHIFDDTNPVSPTDKGITIDIRPYAVDDATDDQVASWPLEAAFGRGHLFIFGKYTNPFYIEYDTDTELFTVVQISIMERDFVGLDDGVNNTTLPTTLSDEFAYNLRNRGWPEDFIDDFFSGQAKYPSKAMLPYLGLKRTLTAGNSYDLDGVRTFSDAKLVAELFQDASAPQGHIIKSPFSTSTTDANALAILTWDFPLLVSPPTTISGPGPYDITFTLDGAHGASVSDVVHMTYTYGIYNTSPGIPLQPALSFEGDYTVSAVPAADEITLSIPYLYALSALGSWPWLSWANQYLIRGTITSDTPPDPTGAVVDFRPKAGAFFAGRTWYAGIDTARLGGRIYFSQVIENDDQYGKCYQVADPTDERISDLVPSDGGVVIIPEATNVLRLVPYSHSLLVYASNGVWEIGPGDLGYFSANSYSVRKVTDSGAVSPGSCILIDNLPVYWGLTDIYALTQNPQTGYLQAQNLSQATINTFYNAIPQTNRTEVVGVYDDLLKRAIWLYRDASVVTNTYDSGLIYDARLQAFTPMAYAYDDDGYLADVFVLKEAGEVSKIKYVGVLTALSDDEVPVLETTINIGETNNTTTYTDFAISEPECFMITGYDSLRDPGTMQEAVKIQVFSKKTEEGYGIAPSYEPIRPSSTQMRARWDWADSTNASKWGAYQEVYRHRRTYIPSDPTTDEFEDGVPLVVTKNNIRGRGRVLQLEFRAGTAKDSWIQGWKTNFVKGS